MDSYEIRRLALINAMHARLGGKQVRLAEALDTRADYVSRMLKPGPNAKRIGGDYAREIETKLGLPMFWLDMPANASNTPTVPAGNGNVAPIPPLQHKHALRKDDFLGAPLFATDAEKAGAKLENLRATIVADTGMAIVDGVRDYVAVVDIAVNTPQDGDIFLIDHGNKLKLRRMVLVGKQWVARSDHAESARYADIAIDDASKQIVGKLIWGGGFLP
jgi:hypothetical protein